MMTRILTSSFLSLGSIFFVFACTRYLDETKVETLVIDEFQSKTGLQLQSVSCPEKEPIQADRSFQCQVTLIDEQSVNVDVEQQDNDGNIRVEIQKGLQTLKGLIDNDLLAQQITTGILEQTQIKVTTDCGSRLRIARAKETFTCTTTDQQENMSEVKVTVKDDQSNLSWEL